MNTNHQETEKNAASIFMIILITLSQACLSTKVSFPCSKVKRKCSFKTRFLHKRPVWLINSVWSCLTNHDHDWNSSSCSVVPPPPPPKVFDFVRRIKTDAQIMIMVKVVSKQSWSAWFHHHHPNQHGRLRHQQWSGGQLPKRLRVRFIVFLARLCTRIYGDKQVHFLHGWLLW